VAHFLADLFGGLSAAARFASDNSLYLGSD